MHSSSICNRRGGSRASGLMLVASPKVAAEHK